MLKWKHDPIFALFCLSDLKRPGKNIWSKPHLRLLSHSQISRPLHLMVRLDAVRPTDRLICKVCLSCSATLIIGPASLNEATVTDNKHIILHIMAVKDLNLHQENRLGDLWLSIWPHQSKILSLLDRYHTPLWTLLLCPTSKRLFSRIDLDTTNVVLTTAFDLVSQRLRKNSSSTSLFSDNFHCCVSSKHGSLADWGW